MRANHDKYGKRLLHELLGERFVTWFEPSRAFKIAGVDAELDGVIKSDDLLSVECAVEVEAKNYKQIRGSILDLAWHPAPKKLLVIIRAQPQLKSEEQVREHCTYVWQRLNKESSVPFSLAVLEGTGDDPSEEGGKLLLTASLRELQII